MKECLQESKNINEFRAKQFKQANRFPAQFIDAEGNLRTGNDLCQALSIMTNSWVKKVLFGLTGVTTVVVLGILGLSRMGSKR